MKEYTVLSATTKKRGKKNFSSWCHLSKGTTGNWTRGLLTGRNRHSRACNRHETKQLNEDNKLITKATQGHQKRRRYQVVKKEPGSALRHGVRRGDEIRVSFQCQSKEEGQGLWLFHFAEHNSHWFWRFHLCPDVFFGMVVYKCSCRTRKMLVYFICFVLFFFNLF